MQAGTLTRRVEIKKYGTTLDEYGEPVPGWTTIATVWGDVRLLSGLETVRSNIAVSEVKASIRIRYIAGIDASMVAVVSGKTYDIEAVLPDVHDREFTDLICKVTA